jgi:cobalt-zinc-cadmium resistance protein CzcA
LEGAKARWCRDPEDPGPKARGSRIFYDRNYLIEKAVWTEQKEQLEALAQVVVLLLLFLGNLRRRSWSRFRCRWRAATFGLPCALCGLSANIMSAPGGPSAARHRLLVDLRRRGGGERAHRFAHRPRRTDLPAAASA